MSIAIITTGSNYDDPLGNQILHSPYVLMLNAATFHYDVVANPLALEDEMQNRFDLIMLMIRKKVSSVLVKKCEPDLKMLLTIHGIHVIESVSGEVGKILNRIREISLQDTHVIPTDNIVSEPLSQTQNKIRV